MPARPKLNSKLCAIFTENIFEWSDSPFLLNFMWLFYNISNWTFSIGNGNFELLYGCDEMFS